MKTIKILNGLTFLYSNILRVFSINDFRRIILVKVCCNYCLSMFIKNIFDEQCILVLLLFSKFFNVDLEHF